MRKMLDAANYPRIVARFDRIDPSAVEQSSQLDFTLRIRNVEKPVTARIRKWKRDGDVIQFKATFDISLHDFDLEAPSVLFIHVADRVGVDVNVTLDEAAPETSAN